MKTLVNRNWKVGLFLVLFLYLYIISLQAVSFKDEGFALSSYQTFFPDPASNGYFFMYYLTMLIGGVWEYLAGWGGILSFRILHSIIVLFCVWIAINSMNQLTHSKAAFVLSSLFEVIFISFNSTSFSYNILSLLLICVMFHQIAGYNETKSSKSVLLIGFLIGLSVYARLPNILFLLVPVPVLIMNRANISEYLFLFLGFLSGLGSILLVMSILGHLSLFIQVIKDVFALGKSDESTHGITKMTLVYFCNLRDVCVVTLSCFAIYYAMQRKQFVAAVLFVSMMTYWILVLVGEIYKPGLYGVIYGVLYFGVIVYWLNHSWPHDETQRLVALHTYLGMALTAIYPLGSDHGIYNVANISTFWLCFVVCAMWIGQTVHSSTYKIAIATTLIFTIIVFERVIDSPSFSGVSRFECISKPKESSLANIYMRPQSADELDGLLRAIKSNTRKGDYVLCYPNIPMINYLSETRPYLYNCWPKLYTHELLKYYLDKAIEEKQSLPVIVRQRQYNNDEKYFLLVDFIHRNGYKAIASNSNYEVLIPNSVK